MLIFYHSYIKVACINVVWTLFFLYLIQFHSSVVICMEIKPVCTPWHYMRAHMYTTTAFSHAQNVRVVVYVPWVSVHIIINGAIHLTHKEICRWIDSCERCEAQQQLNMSTEVPLEYSAVTKTQHAVWKMAIFWKSSLSQISTAMTKYANNAR